MRKKRRFAYAKTKTQISFAVTATRIVQFHYFLNPEDRFSNNEALISTATSKCADISPRVSASDLRLCISYKGKSYCLITRLVI